MGSEELKKEHLQGFLVDAFVNDELFSGNPAAVCLIPSGRSISDSLMQKLASEFNQSETAFIQRMSSSLDGAVYSLRWFTPRVEVELCGHATLASAAALVSVKQWDPHLFPALVFRTLYSGDLKVRAESNGHFEMEFPLLPVEKSPFGASKELLDILHLSSEDIVFYGTSKYDVLLHVKHESILERIQPDFLKLAQVSSISRGIIVTSLADSSTNVDFCSRFFAPKTGINEDPVTGSAHCALADYWRTELGNKKDLIGIQLSSRRGIVSLQVQPDNQVKISGRTRIIMSGIFPEL
eukprot:jgi/Galph1/5583/GphlegSOOS_G4249.1